MHAHTVVLYLTLTFNPAFTNSVNNTKLGPYKKWKHLLKTIRIYWISTRTINNDCKLNIKI